MQRTTNRGASVQHTSDATCSTPPSYPEHSVSNDMVDDWFRFVERDDAALGRAGGPCVLPVPQDVKV